MTGFELRGNGEYDYSQHLAAWHYERQAHERMVTHQDTQDFETVEEEVEGLYDFFWAAAYPLDYPY